MLQTLGGRSEWLTVLAFVYVVAAWALLSGILMLVSAFRLKKDHGRIWLAAACVLLLVAGARAPVVTARSSG